MGLLEIKLEACPCARVGSRHARLVLPSHPELADCRQCGQPVWVTTAGRRSGLKLVCSECFAGEPTPTSVFLARFRDFVRYVGRQAEGLSDQVHRIDAIEAWFIASILHPWEPPIPLEPHQDSELLPPPF
jgi:hypothetical protein